MKKILFLLIICALSFLSASAQDGRRFKWNTKYNNIYSADITSISYNPKNHLFYAIANCFSNVSKRNGTYLFTSADSGKSWEAKNEIAQADAGFNSNYLKIDSDGVLFFVSGGGQILCRSKDDGITFDTIFVSDIKDYKLDSKGTIYIISLEKEIYVSQDKGDSWETYPTGFYVHKMMIDKDDNVFLLTSPERTFEQYKAQIYQGSRLIESRNELYLFDKNYKYFNFLLSSNGMQNQKTIFFDLADNGNGISLLKVNEFYENDGDMWADSHFEEPYILELNENHQINKSTKLDLPEYQYYFLWNIVSTCLHYNQNQNLMLLWKNLNMFNHDLSDFKNLKLEELDEYAENSYFSASPEFSYIFFQNGEAGTYYSSDDGNTWIDPKIKLEIHDKFINVYQKRDSSIIYIDTLNRLLTTANYGLSWNNISSGIKKNDSISVIHETVQGRLIVGTKNLGILFLNDNNEWEKRNKGLNNVSVTAFCETSDGKIIIGTKKGIYISDDECLNNKLLLNESCKELMADGENIFLVTNDGKLICLEFENGILIDSRRMLSSYYVTTLAINKNGCIIAGTKSNGVFKSTNHGFSWAASNNELYSPRIYQIISTENNEFIALAQTGIFYTNDEGKIWEKNSYNSYNENHPPNNLNDEFKLIKLSYGTIFKKYKNDIETLDSISSDRVKEKTGWENGDRCLVSKDNFPNGTTKFSKDRKYLISNRQSIGYNVPGYYYKYDYESGKRLEEWLVPFYDHTNEVLDRKEDGTIKILRNDQYDKNEPVFIFGYNLQEDKSFDSIFICDKQGRYYKLGPSAVSDDGNRVFLQLNFTDSSDKSGTDLYLIENKKLKFRKAIDSANYYIQRISPDCRYLLTTDLRTYYNIFDIENDRTYSIDTTGLFNSSNNDEEYNFTNNNRWLYFKFRTHPDIRSNLFYDLSELNLQNKLKSKQKFILKTNYTLYLGNSDFLLTVDTLFQTPINYGQYFLRYNAEQNKIKSRSSLPYFDFIDSYKVLAPDKKSFIVDLNILRKFNLDELLNCRVLDFTADTTVCKTGDYIEFTAEYDGGIQEYIWNFGDGWTDLGYKTEHFYRKPGKYDVTLKYLYNGKYDSTVKSQYISVTQGTGVDENIGSYFFISPNPATDFIDISYSPFEKGIRGLSDGIKIYNVFGEEVTTPALRATPPYEGGENSSSHYSILNTQYSANIDVSGFQPGVYFVRIGDNVIKFIKI